MKRDAALLLLLMFAMPALAHAHELTTPKTDAVTVSREGARVEVEHSISAAKSAEIRRLYDHDGNGRIDDAERALLEAYVRLVATRPVGLELDGKALALEVESARVDAPAKGDIHARITLVARWKLAPGAHRVAFRDRHPDAAVPAALAFGEGLSGTPARASLTAAEPVLAVAFEAS